MTEAPRRYSARPDGAPSISEALTGAQINRLENALSDVIGYGWGSVTLIVDRGEVTLIEKRTTERMDKLK